MKYSVIILLLFFIFSGCQNVDQPEKPKDLIPKDKMVDILIETYLSNAARSVDNRSITTNGIKMDSMIYKNFGIDSLQFARSNTFYAADINAYMDIFKQVESRLDVMQKKMDSLWERDRDIRDSINKNLKEDPINIEPAKDSLI